jgi:dihydroneopterin aldolase/2-amino-4-hydroxy-6-hydroxymethyldihydropteridine diphosphokinase
VSDRISLRGIRARGHHGVLASERRDGQDFVVDVEMDLDLAPAGASDDLADTVNYADVAAAVVGLVEGQPVDLIEALAERIASSVLGAHPLVEAVEVTVHKPQAPVGHPFDDVAVTISRARAEPVVIALGSNVGDTAQTLQQALWDLAAAEPALTLTAVSPLYDTEPVGGPEQPAYANAVALGTTRLTPLGLLRVLQHVETENGRVRDVRWGPRTLDLDLIQYGDPRRGEDARGQGAELRLPHPRAHERAFVLVPWAEADPDAVLRVDGQVVPVASLLEAVDTAGVRPSAAPWDPQW